MDLFRLAIKGYVRSCSQPRPTLPEVYSNGEFKLNVRKELAEPTRRFPLAMVVLILLGAFSFDRHLEASVAEAHPGRTDANGCHTCRTKCTKRWGIPYGYDHRHSPVRACFQQPAPTATSVPTPKPSPTATPEATPSPSPPASTAASPTTSPTEQTDPPGTDELSGGGSGGGNYLETALVSAAVAAAAVGAGAVALDRRRHPRG